MSDPPPVAVPPCNYPDPVQANCYHAGVLYAQITCRQIDYNTGTLGMLQTTCNYKFCDTNVVCESDHTKFQQKIRTKTFTIDGGGTCTAAIHLIDVHDVVDGCCFCNMQDVPPVPTGPK